MSELTDDISNNAVCSQCKKPCVHCMFGELDTITDSFDSKEAELKISKKARNLLKLCKLVLNKSTYDEVILFLVGFYKKHKISKS